MITGHLPVTEKHSRLSDLKIYSGSKILVAKSLSEARTQYVKIAAYITITVKQLFYCFELTSV